MFQDMEISKVLAEVFDSSAEAKDILEDMGFGLSALAAQPDLRLFHYLD